MSSKTEEKKDPILETPNAEAPKAPEAEAPKADVVKVLEDVINEQGEAIKALTAKIDALSAKSSVAVVAAPVKKKDIIYLDGEISYKVQTPRFQVPDDKGGMTQIDLTTANQKELSAAFKKYDWAFKKIN